MELSNKSLALLLIATIIISFGGTILSLNKLSEIRPGAPLKRVTGMAQAGQVNLTLGNVTSCNVDTNVDFGTGNPTTTVTLTTYNGSLTAQVGAGFNNCSNSATTACYNGMQINNTGNTNINVTFISSVNASGLLGDANAPLANFRYNIINGTYKSLTYAGCAGILGSGGDINASANASICTNMTSETGIDIVSLGFNVTINESTPKGAKTATITIACAAV